MTWDPHQYDKFKTQRSEPFYDLLQVVKNQNRSTFPKNILDLGCGTGELTRELASVECSSTVLGIDSSDEMLQKASYFTSPQLNFAKEEIFDYLIKTTSQWDLIFSNAALQWCQDHEKLIPWIAKRCAKGGQIAIQMPMNFDYPTHSIAREVAETEPFRSTIAKFPQENGHKNVLKPEQYSELLFRLGFSEQKVWMHVYPHVLESREAVLEWVRGTMLTQYRKVLGSADYEEFERVYREKLDFMLPDNRPFFYPFKRLFIWGRLKTTMANS